MSEHQLQRQLPDARIARAGDLAEAARAFLCNPSAGGWIVQVHAIEDVEVLGTELQVKALSHLEVLHQSHVPRPILRAAQLALAGITEAAGSRLLESRGIDPRNAVWRGAAIITAIRIPSEEYRAVSPVPHT